MDYCIYKTIDDGTPRIIHTFTQAATNSHAKVAAKQRLNDMWIRVARRPTQYRNLKGDNFEFSYDMQLTTEKFVRARFYIAPAPKEQSTK